ncbi:hypothetical protein AB7M35_001871 [Amorphus suaedae]
MPSEHLRRAGFLTAVCDAGADLPDGLTGPDGARDPKRFQVYRNTVAATLVHALAATFPAVRRLVGEAYFRAAARAYAAAEKPASPLLFRYGATFPDFLAGLESLAAYPYVPDVARLEAAWLAAYHAAEAAPLAAGALARIPAERLAETRLALHPATRIVCSVHPLVTIWRANRGDGPVPAVLPAHGEDALVVRPGIEVGVHRLPAGTAAFARALGDGLPLAAAAETAAAAHAGFDLAESLTLLLTAGALTVQQEEGHRPCPS